MLAFISLGSRQGPAGKEQSPEGLGRPRGIRKENTDLLISAIFQPRRSRGKHYTLSPSLFQRALLWVLSLPPWKKTYNKKITGGIEFSLKLVVIQYAQTNGPNGDGVSLLWIELNGTGPLRVNDRIIKVWVLPAWKLKTAEARQAVESYCPLSWTTL